MSIAIAIIFFLLLSALFSGTEIAFISASKLKIELKRQKGSKSGSILSRFYKSPASFLATMLVGNNIALVIFTSLMTNPLDTLFSNYFDEGNLLLLLINTIIITIIVLIFGEFLPKTIFRLFADDILYFLAYPLRFLQFFLAIPAWLMTKLSNFLLRVLFKMPVEKVENVITRLDLENFIRDTQTKSEEENIDTDLFERALHLKQVKVRECMVPRPEIESIDIKASVEQLKKVFLEKNHSRLIVTDGDIDNILGYVHHQKLLKDPSTIKQIKMDIPIVPEVMNVRHLMNVFIKTRINIAWVVDEFGGTAGIITLEDILEEIFGEIEDEHDQEEYIEEIISEEEYRFSGRLEIDYLNEKYEDLNFPEGDYHTLSGYLVMTNEMIPAQGAEIELDGYKFVLDLVSDTKIEIIRVFKLPANDEEKDQ